ncbi:MAG: aromatic amino acid lyase [Pseudomonadota bacterium]
MSAGDEWIPVSSEALLQALRAGTFPWPDSETDKIGQRLNERYARFCSYAKQMEAKGEPIYGTLTMPGHRDDEAVSLEHQTVYQKAMITSHAIGGAPYFDGDTARAILLARITTLAQPGPAISSALWHRYVDAYLDPQFSPDIPENASYSSGDVIPAAHLAHAVLFRSGANSNLGPGEGMAVLNGAFVHMGVVLRLAGKALQTWPIWAATMKRSLTALNADPRPFLYPNPEDTGPLSTVLTWLVTGCAEGNHPVQDPVSLRTLRQMITAFRNCGVALMTMLEMAFNSPIGNPLFFMGEARDGSKDNHTPSGSFATPELGIAVSGLCEALLAMAWMSVRRTHHLVSQGLSSKTKKAGDPGLVQWPKLAEAQLATLRQRHGARAYTSGSGTSEGIEDFWTHGTAAARDALALIDGVHDLMAIELFVANPAHSTEDGGDLNAARSIQAELMDLCRQDQNIPPLFLMAEGNRG